MKRNSEKISIGNNSFTNDLQQALYTGEEIEKLKGKELIWFDEVVTNQINWIKIDFNKKYAFRHIDENEKLIGKRNDDLKGIEIVECININKYEFIYV